MIFFLHRCVPVRFAHLHYAVEKERKTKNDNNQQPHKKYQIYFRT